MQFKPSIIIYLAVFIVLLFGNSPVVLSEKHDVFADAIRPNYRTTSKIMETVGKGLQKNKYPKGTHSLKAEDWGAKSGTMTYTSVMLYGYIRVPDFYIFSNWTTSDGVVLNGKQDVRPVIRLRCGQEDVLQRHQEQKQNANVR